MSKQQKITLLSFPGCPNLPVLKTILEDEGINSYEEVNLESLSENDSLKNYSSPTLLIGDEIIIGTKISKNSMSCSYLSRNEMVEIIGKQKRRLKFL